MRCIQHPNRCQGQDNRWVVKTAIMINALTIWLAEQRMIHPIKIKTKLLTAFSCCIFTAAFALLLETNWYYQQYLHYLHNTPSRVPDVAESEIYIYLAAVTQIRHSTWQPVRQFNSYFPSFIAKLYDTILIHILRFLHFPNNDNAPGNNEQTMTYLWLPDCQILYIVHIFKAGIILMNCIPKGHMFQNISL